jgi:thioredoxin 1
MKLYHFTAEWCSPCKKLAPVLEQFLTENKDIDYIKIDVDDQGYFAQENNVMSVPTLIIKKDDVELKRHKGVANMETLKGLFDGL